MPALPEIRSQRVRAVPATPERATELQACLDGAPGYFELTEGAPAERDAAIQLLADAEADDQRRVFLLLAVAGEAERSRPSGGEPLGVLDLYLHHPEPGVAHVGLLLLREAVQGRGLGRELVEALAAALATAGFTAVRASVADENASAREFWERLGFAAAGRLEQRVTVYELPLAP